MGRDRDFKFGRYVDRTLQVLAHGCQTVPERGVVRSREPFKFWWAPTIFPVRNGQILHACRLCQVAAQRWQITLKRGVIRVT